MTWCSGRESFLLGITGGMSTRAEPWQDTDDWWSWGLCFCWSGCGNRSRLQLSLESAGSVVESATEECWHWAGYRGHCLIQLKPPHLLLGQCKCKKKSLLNLWRVPYLYNSVYFKWNNNNKQTSYNKLWRWSKDSKWYLQMGVAEVAAWSPSMVYVFVA